MNRVLRHTLIAAAWVLTSQAFAHDPTPAAADKLTGVREHIAAKRWQPALEELRRVNDPASADWNNLMGYSLRRQATPDYGAAGRHYDEALRLDPKHRGALEYSGELSLIVGDLPKAEERLSALDKACRFSCEEYRDLKKSVERYKAAGNKYIAAQ